MWSIKSKFHAIAFFDHSVFELTDSTSLKMTAERERLWGIYEKRSSRGRKPGEFYVSTPITTSGHSIYHTRLAGDLAGVINFIDHKLDDLSSRSEVFADVLHEVVKAMKLRWHLNYLDLGLLDKTTSIFHVLRHGVS